MPTGPPPTTTALSGISVRSVASLFVQNPASAKPGIGGTTASAPVATTIASVVRTRSPTVTRPGPSIRPVSLKTATPRSS
jgi:hypothetical protein